jgi:hypothetical protein
LAARKTDPSFEAHALPLRRSIDKGFTSVTSTRIHLPEEPIGTSSHDLRSDRPESRRDRFVLDDSSNSERGPDCVCQSRDLCDTRFVRRPAAAIAQAAALSRAGRSSGQYSSGIAAVPDDLDKCRLGILAAQELSECSLERDSTQPCLFGETFGNSPCAAASSRCTTGAAPAGPRAVATPTSHMPCGLAPPIPALIARRERRASRGADGIGMRECGVARRSLGRSRRILVQGDDRARRQRRRRDRCALAGRCGTDDSHPRPRRSGPSRGPAASANARRQAPACHAEARPRRIALPPNVRGWLVDGNIDLHPGVGNHPPVHSIHSLRYRHLWYSAEA